MSSSYEFIAIPKSKLDDAEIDPSINNNLYTIDEYGYDLGSYNCNHFPESVIDLIRAKFTKPETRYIKIDNNIALTMMRDCAKLAIDENDEFFSDIAYIASTVYHVLNQHQTENINVYCQIL